MIIIKHGTMYRFVCTGCGCDFCVTADECDIDANNVSCNCPDCNNRLEHGARIYSSEIRNLIQDSVSVTINKEDAIASNKHYY